MTRTLTASVVIVGGGPVGVCLAIDLAWRGVDSVVIERRHPAEPPSVKCNHVSSRTMEFFRRLGLAQEGLLQLSHVPGNQRVISNLRVSGAEGLL